jgi:5'-3' exonuclease
MGIRHLNQFFKKNATNSIKLCKLSELSGKKIAIDISIYMYKFATENLLIENIYLMLSIFRHYNIIPIFIFDGKATADKHELLNKRKQDKKEAENEYNKLKLFIDTNNYTNEIDKEEIISTMNSLKKKIVSIHKTDIENVKKLIVSYGASYYDAPYEADEVCAMLSIKEKVWACLSEDMDMFVYGCPRIIRYISLLNHTAVVYHLENILNDLGITQKDLREICVLSGTDYNIKNTDENNLYTTLKYFKKYRNTNLNIGFFEWLKTYNKYILQDYSRLINIYNIFDLNYKHYDKINIDKIEIKQNTILKEEIKEILKKDGFIFPT